MPEVRWDWCVGVGLLDHVDRWMEVERFEEVLARAGAKVQWPTLEDI